MSTTYPHRRVLVVEDDPEIAQLVGSMLRQRSLTVDVASGGREAIDLLRDGIYSVIILDLLMPQPDGFAVLSAMGSAAVPPVVLVLTAAEASVIDQLDPQRIHGIIRKPFDPEELTALVVACSEIRGRGNFEMMAVAMMSTARLLDLLS